MDRPKPICPLNFFEVGGIKKLLCLGQHIPTGNVFIAQGQTYLKRMIQPCRNSNCSEILSLSCIPASLKELLSKLKVLLCRQYFPHDKSMGLSWLPQFLKKMGSKSICSRSPTQTILHVKFDQDWQAISGDIYV